MGYKEAVEDGIKIISGFNYTAYYPKCHICGEEMKVMAYIRNTNLVKSYFLEVNK